MKTAALSLAILLLQTPLAAAEVCYNDGIYTGSCSFITVEVTIAEGIISDIDIVEHKGGGEKYKNMVEPLIKEIIDSQSLEIDAISGATVSSNYLEKAIEDALDQAAIKN